MWYSKYSNFSPDMIIDERYEELCEVLLNMSKDEKVKEKIKGILYEGGFDDFSVNTEMMNKDNPRVETSRRLSMAYLLATNPETFDILLKNRINLFHGTNANVLPSILTHGMNSVNELSKKGIDITTGEEWSRIGGKRDFISFTDDLDLATGYSSFHKSDKKQSFGALIGISSDDTPNMRKCKIDSDTQELGIKDKVPLEYIRFIGVSPERVEFVKKLVGDNQIIVAPLDMDDRFYYVNDFGDISFDTTRIKNSNNHTESSTTFSQKDVGKLATGRKKSSIHSVFQSLRDSIKSIIEKKGIEYDDDREQ